LLRDKLRLFGSRVNCPNVVQIGGISAEVQL
jgi:hypothetical protein